MLTAKNIKNTKIKECFLTFYNGDKYRYLAKRPLKKGEIIFPNEYKLIKEEAMDEETCDIAVSASDSSNR